MYRTSSLIAAVMISTIALLSLSYTAWAAPEDRGTNTWSQYSIKIPARDGVSISALIYIPTVQQPYPLLTLRHGLSAAAAKNLPLTSYGEHYASRGFVVLLPNSRFGLSPDYTIDADDVNDCMTWAVNKGKKRRNSILSGKIDETKQAIGGTSAGALVSIIATAKNNTDPNAFIKYGAVMCLEPGEVNGLAQYYAPMVFTPTITIFGENTLCNGFGQGIVIFNSVTGPAYGLKVPGADHCDAASRYNQDCVLTCFGSWDEAHNKSFRRYGTAFLEAYLKCDSAAFPYIYGSIAQSDPLVELFPDSHDLGMPPTGCQSALMSEELFASPPVLAEGLTLTPGLKAWEYLTGSSVYSSPAVAGGYVYVASDDSKVYCLNAQTGTKVWEYATGNQVGSSPAVAGGNIYIGSDDGKVYCLNAQTGTKVWEYATGNQVGSSPAVAGGNIYIGSDDGKVYCLNAQTGTKVWEYLTGGIVESSPAVSNGYVYMGSYDGKVYCLNALSGAKVWDYATGDTIDSSPAVYGGFVYVGSNDGKVYCLNSQSGVKVWEYATGSWVYSSPSVAGGYVYVASDDSKVYCLNAQTGAKVWEYVTGDWVGSSPAVVAGYVYIGSDDGKVYCLNAQTGAKIWEYKTGGFVESSPAVAGGYVYIASDDSKVYCLNDQTGAKIWEYATSAWIGSSLAVSNGFVYVGGDDGKVYCLAAMNTTGSWPMFKNNNFRAGSPDTDNDGIMDIDDNCPNKPNGPNYGSCSATSDNPGITCTSDADCVIGCSSNGLCIKDQRDSDGDGVGDVCDVTPITTTTVASTTTTVMVTTSTTSILPTTTTTSVRPTTTTTVVTTTTTALPIPSPPSNLTATAISTSQINLSWTDNSGNETGFKIECGTSSSGPFSQIATVSANVKTYQNTGLKRNTTYYYRVRAYNAAGNSGYSNTASATTRKR